MARNGSGAVARKERGEERSKLKWMKEAHKNRKRAESAELRLAELREQLTISQAPERIPAAPSISLEDVSYEQHEFVNRAELDAVRVELNQFRTSYSQVLEMNKLLLDKSTASEAELLLAKENLGKLENELAESRSAESIARRLYKDAIERVKHLEEIAVNQVRSETQQSSFVKTPHNVGNQVTSKNFSPITPEQLDFTDSSLQRTCHTPSGFTVPSRQVQSIWQIFFDFLSGLVVRLFGRRATHLESKPLTA